MKTKRDFNKILNYFFIFTGTKLYFNYILPTNPVSKNPLFKALWGYKNNKMLSCESRIILAFIFGGIHILGFVTYIVTERNWCSNILINVYPVIVQICIGLKCYLVLTYRKTKIHQKVLSVA